MTRRTVTIVLMVLSALMTGICAFGMVVHITLGDQINATIDAGAVAINLAGVGLNVLTMRLIKTTERLKQEIQSLNAKNRPRLFKGEGG